MTANADLVLRNARIMTCDPARGPGLGIVEHAALAIVDGQVAWLGADADRPRADHERDLGGRLVTPGLVDCHTHAIFAGDRANEFGMRAQGKTYLEIAAAGGGIAATLGPTRALSENGHVDLLSSRLDTTLALGTTAVEVKSGYDLTVDGELKLLRAIATTTARRSQRVVATLLAHLIPPERAGDRDRFVAELRDQLIPAVARGRLATSVDIYCDRGAFTLAEARAILGAAKTHGLGVRAHAGQFEDLGAAELVAELGGLSVDHVEQISEVGIAAIAAAGVVAVMLPGACVQLRLPVPPVDQLRAAGVTMAVATDLNPGSSYCESLLVQLWLATTHFGMTLDEAWLGVTRNAAKALGISAGTLAAEARADLVVWHADDPATIPYRYGLAHALIDEVYVGGRAHRIKP